MLPVASPLPCSTDRQGSVPMKYEPSSQRKTTSNNNTSKRAHQEEGHETKVDCIQAECRSPAAVTASSTQAQAKNVQADVALEIDVWMINQRVAVNLGRLVGISIRQVDAKLELRSFVQAIARSNCEDIAHNDVGVGEGECNALRRNKLRDIYILVVSNLASKSRVTQQYPSVREAQPRSPAEPSSSRLHLRNMRRCSVHAVEPLLRSDNTFSCDFFLRMSAISELLVFCSMNGASDADGLPGGASAAPAAFAASAFSLSSFSFAAFSSWSFLSLNIECMLWRRAVGDSSEEALGATLPCQNLSLQTLGLANGCQLCLLFLLLGRIACLESPQWSSHAYKTVR